MLPEVIPNSVLKNIQDQFISYIMKIEAKYKQANSSEEVGNVSIF